MKKLEGNLGSESESLAETVSFERNCCVSQAFVSPRNPLVLNLNARVEGLFRRRWKKTQKKFGCSSISVAKRIPENFLGTKDGSR